MMAVKPIPEGYHTVTPYLIVQGAETLIKFLTQAFAATEIRRTLHPEATSRTFLYAIESKLV